MAAATSSAAAGSSIAAQTPEAGSARTVTFLLTDIEGSTQSWERHPDEMRVALGIHDRLVAENVRGHGGSVLTSHGEGDSFFAVFDTAPAGVAAACSIQRNLSARDLRTPLQLRVRMALHSGVVERDHRGPAANRCARIRACAHGGQVLLSSASADQVQGALPGGTKLRALGEHRLRDLAQPERIYQLVIQGLRSRFPPLRSLGAFDHNLPVQSGAFIGRRREIFEVRRRLIRARLLTLHGAGGCGKTALAVRAAAGIVRRYPGGVWFVDLASLRDPSLLTQMIAASLGVHEVAERTVLPTLTGRFRERPVLLILDNCEHVASACADVAELLLSQCPELRILATSREVLNATGETALRVPSLSMPNPEQPPSSEELRDYEAIALFLERGSRAGAGFELRDQNAAAITQICRRLDGMPLAIELAAACVKVMTPDEILAHLERRFDLLIRSGRVVNRRHHTLRAMVDWSYDLLDSAERVLFDRISVFTGGARLEAVEAVCVGGPVEPNNVVKLLQQLVDKSLLVVQEKRHAARHQLLETLREYGRDRLVAAGIAEDMSARHLGYFLLVAEAAEDAAGGPDESAWSDRLADDYENLSAALSVARDRDGDSFLRLATALARFWWSRGRLTEGRQWLTQALALRQEQTPLRARALNWLGMLAWHQRDYTTAARLYGESLSIWQVLGDKLGEGRCLNNLAAMAYDQTRFGVALRYFRRLQPLYREEGDNRMAAIVGQNIGLVRTEQGALEEGRQLLGEFLQLVRDLANTPLMAHTLSSVGINALYRDDRDGARSAFAEGLDLSQKINDRLAAVFCLEGYAWVAAADRRPAPAFRLVGAVSSVRRQIGAPPAPVIERRQRRWLGPLSDALGESASELMREGSLMSLDEAADYARSAVGPHRPEDP